ncbi:MAG: PilT protein domain protein [Verrucomicrobiales bacterium]|jgi:PIN domain nuclease of toxin-antitoxin system|nr:PilT protein domain protein [Verrucomicrobiales bacterium]
MRTVLLDTQIALWLLADNPRLPKHLRSATESETDICWIFHQVSLSEIQIKYSIGKLPLPDSPEKYLPEAISNAGFEERTIENDGGFFLDKLPNHHSDPFDRLLISHVMINGWEAASVDAQWEKYPIRIFRG